MKKVLAGFFAFLFLFTVSVGQATATTGEFPVGEVLVTTKEPHNTKVFYSEKGTIYLHLTSVNDPKFGFIDFRVELYKEDGTLVQTRLGMVFDPVMEDKIKFTIPENGNYYVRLVNETPESDWHVKYEFYNQKKVIYLVGNADVTTEAPHKTEIFQVKKGTIYFQHINITDPEFDYINTRVELYKEDGTLLQTRIGNVYNFESESESEFTIPEDGNYYVRLVNETPKSNWYVKYEITNETMWDY